MDILDAIRRRRAVREYKIDAVPKTVLRALIEAATWAPSAMNAQPWRFIVITDRALLDRISENGKRWWLDHQPGLSGDAAHLRSVLDDPSLDIFHHAPALIAIATPELTKWNREGCALAAQNIMLAALAHGLGSCWIGLAEGFLNSPGGRELLKLPPAEHVVAPIIIGYPRQMPEPIARQAPHIVWIAEKNTIAEEGEPPEPLLGHGVYGTLIHP